jgi:hypothetical protein
MIMAFVFGHGKKTREMNVLRCIRGLRSYEKQYDNIYRLIIF